MARRDAGEFLGFADAYREHMRKTAYLLCGDWDRAADITQEALIRLYIAWPRLDPDAALRGYARRTVTNVAIDLSRKSWSRERPAEVEVSTAVPDETAGVAERLLLMAALAELPPRQRACVVLRYYEDLSVMEVSDVLGCRPGTVKSQTARGLAALREAYRRRGGDLAAAGPEPAAPEGPEPAGAPEEMTW
jgi:RNA polymerase sigma-70 factor (sigma-E family)